MAGLAATGFCTATFAATGLTTGFADAAAFTATLGITVLGATALAAVLGGALVAAVLAAGALTGAFTGALAVVLAEFFVITLLFLEDVVLAGLTETTLPFLWDAPDFGALAADERAVVVFGERATAAREALADFAVNFLAFVLEFFALW